NPPPGGVSSTWRGPARSTAPRSSPGICSRRARSTSSAAVAEEELPLAGVAIFGPFSGRPDVLVHVRRLRKVVVHDGVAGGLRGRLRLARLGPRDDVVQAGTAIRF